MPSQTDPQRAFPQRLRSARELRELSQLELAEQSHLQQAAVSLYESGARRPSLRNLSRLAEALEVTTDYLLGLADQPEPMPSIHEPLYVDFANLTAADRRLARQLIAQLVQRAEPS